MTESEIHKIVKNWLSNQGRILRIENTVSQGTVDAIIFYRGRSLMAEYKIIRSGKIKVRKFQLSTAVDYTTYAMPNSQYNFFCASDGTPGISVYSTAQIMNAPCTFTTNDKELMISLKNIIPKHILRNSIDFNAWLDQFN